MVKKGSPKRLWDQCIELEGLIHYRTAHSSYELGGEVPETRITGNTSNISNICEYECYQWVMFCDEPITYIDLPAVMR